MLRIGITRFQLIMALNNRLQWTFCFRFVGLLLVTFKVSL